MKLSSRDHRRRVFQKKVMEALAQLIFESSIREGIPKVFKVRMYPTPDQAEKAKKKRRRIEMNFQGQAKAHEHKYRDKLAHRFFEMRREITGNIKSSKLFYEKYAVRPKFDVDQWLFSKKKWRKSLAEDNKKYMGAAFHQAGELALDALGVRTGFDVMHRRAIEWLAQSSRNAGWSITDTMYDRVREELMEAIALGESIPDIRDRIDELFDEISEERAELIARTETLRASNRGTVEGMKQSGVVVRKIWLTTEDDRTCDWCADLDGTEVGVEETFYNEGDMIELDTGASMSLGYEDIESPPLHPDCRCTLLAEVEEIEAPEGEEGEQE